VQIEGRRPVIEALRARRQLTEILIASGSQGAALGDIVNLAERRGVPVREIPRREIEERAESRNPQGVIAIAGSSFKYATLDEIVSRAARPLLLIALDGVTDPQNLGAIARSAEAVGASGLIVPRRRSAPVTVGAEKTSAGALEHLPVAQVANLARALAELKEQNVWVIALDGDAPTTIYDVPADGDICLVVGSEGSGVSRLVLEAADHRASIPMHGKVGSLNASAASAIALFEIRRRR
jgi:23S rRNA (guanosine2251-2'-O)-methyltransferase